jgi:esterase/lipase
MDITSLISGLGIGGLVTLLLKEYFEKRKITAQREFQEKRDAYVNFLEIVSRSQTMPGPEGNWARTAAIERIKLCGSQKVVTALMNVLEAPSKSQRDVDALFRAMREDIFPGSL